MWRQGDFSFSHKVIKTYWTKSFGGSNQFQPGYSDSIHRSVKINSRNESVMNFDVIFQWGERDTVGRRIHPFQGVVRVFAQVKNHLNNWRDSTDAIHWIISAVSSDYSNQSKKATFLHFVVFFINALDRGGKILAFALLSPFLHFELLLLLLWYTKMLWSYLFFRQKKEHDCCCLIITVGQKMNGSKRCFLLLTALRISQYCTTFN